MQSGMHAQATKGEMYEEEGPMVSTRAWGRMWLRGNDTLVLRVRRVALTIQTPTHAKMRPWPLDTRGWVCPQKDYTTLAISGSLVQGGTRKICCQPITNMSQKYFCSFSKKDQFKS